MANKNKTDMYFKDKMAKFSHMSQRNNFTNNKEVEIVLNLIIIF
jgi:hypothetical protein